MMDIKLVKPGKILHWLNLLLLYLEAFPAAERKPIHMIISMYRKSKTDIWCLEKEGKFVGLAITINSADLILLDYFAIVRSCRCGGIGSKALRHLQDLYDGKGFFIEIESTLEDAPNWAQRAKRKQFYLAAGMQELGVTAKLFGVNMELLGVRCRLTYDAYKRFYKENYNEWASNHIAPT